jgi:hypothetical protein
MSQVDSIPTTDPSAPTTSELDAMWLAQRRLDEEEADRRALALTRRIAASIYGEAA